MSQNQGLKSMRKRSIMTPYIFIFSRIRLAEILLQSMANYPVKEWISNNWNTVAGMNDDNFGTYNT